MSVRRSATVGSALRWGATTLAVAVLVGCSAPEPVSPPVAAPMQGWLIASDDGCTVTSDEVRATADGLQRTGLAAAGYRTLLAACAGELRFVVDDDRAFLRAQGLSLETITPADPRVRQAVPAGVPVVALQTAITRAVMTARPLIVAGEARVVVPPENLAVLTRADVLDVARDDRRAAGAPVHDDPNVSVRAVGATGLLVGLINPAAERRVVSVAIADLNLMGDDSVPATELWTGRRLHAVDGRLAVELDPGASALLAIG